MRALSTSPSGQGVVGAQIPERLRFLGEGHAMAAEPLGDFFTRVGHTPAFAIHSTALWRGYIGDWEIVNDRLYLIGINASFEDGTPVRLVDLFPGFNERVFAHWFSGDLRLAQGRPLAGVHAGHANGHERDLCLRLQRGVLVHVWTRHTGRVEWEGPWGDGPRPAPSAPSRAPVGVQA